MFAELGIAVGQEGAGEGKRKKKKDKKAGQEGAAQAPANGNTDSRQPPAGAAEEATQSGSDSDDDGPVGPMDPAAVSGLRRDLAAPGSRACTAVQTLRVPQQHEHASAEAGAVPERPAGHAGTRLHMRPEACSRMHAHVAWISAACMHTCSRMSQRGTEPLKGLC